MSYPIKYGVLELKEPSGWPMGSREATRGYIVSKCYLVREITEYLEDGNFKRSYQVVFPYRKYYQFKIAMKTNALFEEYPQRPNFNACVTELAQVYDDYSSAAMEVLKLNGELRNRLITQECNLSTDGIVNAYVKTNQRINDELVMCSRYEEYIASRTEELKTSKDQVKKLPSDPF